MPNRPVCKSSLHRCVIVHQMLQVLQILHYVDGIFTSRIAASFY